MTDQEKDAEIMNLQARLFAVTRQRDQLFEEIAGWRWRFVGVLLASLVAGGVAIVNGITIVRLVTP